MIKVHLNSLIINSILPLFIFWVALKEANKELLDKVSPGRNVGDKELFSLSWTVDGLSGQQRRRFQLVLTKANVKTVTNYFIF